MDSHLEQGQEEQGQCLVNRSIDQSLGQEQEEPSEAHILAEESLHRRVEIVRHTTAEDQSKESVGEYALLVEGLGARQTLGGDISRGGQNASAVRSSQWVRRTG